MRIGRLIVRVHFYRKNMKIRGTKLWEIIPANARNAKGCIVSLYFTHIFITWLDPEWKSMLYRYHDYLVKETDIQEGRATKNPNNSPCGTHYERGTGNGLIRARAKLEDMFKLWD